MIFYFFALICTSNFKLLLLLVQVQTDKLIVTIVEINQEQFQANSVSEENYHLKNISVKIKNISEGIGIKFYSGVKLILTN